MRRAVVGLSRQGGRWQVQLQGEDAETVTAEAVVIAAGVWTTGVGQMMGAHLPTIPLALTMTVTMRIPKLIPHLVQHAGGKLSPEAGAGRQYPDRRRLACAAAVVARWPAGFQTSRTCCRLRLPGMPQWLIRVLPELAAVPVIRSWVGTTTITPDQLPLVGPVPGTSGGICRHGWIGLHAGAVFRAGAGGFDRGAGGQHGFELGSPCRQIWQGVRDDCGTTPCRPTGQNRHLHL